LPVAAIAVRLLPGEGCSVAGNPSERAAVRHIGCSETCVGTRPTHEIKELPMMRSFRTAALTGLLALAGVVANADRADAQVYYSYYPGTTYYTTPSMTYYSPGYTYSSYYTPSTTWYTPGYTYNTYYTAPYTNYSTMPYSTWNGATTWSSYPGTYYSSPVTDVYNTYRAYRGMFRR